jgi:hypothetical protein
MTEAGLYSGEPIDLCEERDCYMVTLFILVGDRLTQMLERGVYPTFARTMAQQLLGFVCELLAQ